MTNDVDVTYKVVRDVLRGMTFQPVPYADIYELNVEGVPLRITGEELCADKAEVLLRLPAAIQRRRLVARTAYDLGGSE
jgi:hypothetical protein